MNKQTNDDKKKKKRKEMLTLLGLCIAVVLIVLGMYRFIGGPMLINGASMEPTLIEKDVVIVNRLAYIGKSKPERYDLVAFPYKMNIHRKLVKRVIGLPGETIKIEKDVVYLKTDVGWEKLGEYYGSYVGYGTSKLSNYGPITIEEGKYFVMGDNRYESVDSRSDDIGLIDEEDIIGKVTFRLYPFNGIGSLDY